jgi:hypothetical protein
MEPYVCDVRVGAVAVYRGPTVNCFNGLPETAYYGRGKVTQNNGEGVRWSVSWRRVLWAHLVCWWLNFFDALMDDGEGAA